MKKIGGDCTLNDCDQPYYGKGLCKKHYDARRNLERRKQVAERNRNYHLANRDTINARKREQSKLNPERSRKGTRVRRARKNGGKLASYTEAEVLELYGTLCYLCDKEIDLQAPRRTGLPGWERGLHIDHNVLIAAGGDDNIENVRPTHGLCNLKRPKIRR